MQKFLFIFNGSDPYKNDSEAQKSIQDWTKWIQELAQKDIFVSGEQLIPNGKIISGKQKQLVDGPFTESKEIISGIFVIKAADLDAAVQIAQDCPIFDFNGNVEVRPVLALN